jgi:hypothetical protein
LQVNVDIVEEAVFASNSDSFLIDVILDKILSNVINIPFLTHYTIPMRYLIKNIDGIGLNISIVAKDCELLSIKSIVKGKL